MSAKPSNGSLHTCVARLGKCISAASTCISGISFVGMLAIVLVAIALRIMEIPFFWGEEAARYLMFVGVYIGMSVAVREKAHLGVDIFVNLFPAKISRYIRLFAFVVTTAVYVMITKVCWDFTARMARGKQISPALSIPMYIMYGIIFVGFALCCLESMFLIWNEYVAPPNAMEKEAERRDEEEVHLL